MSKNTNQKNRSNRQATALVTSGMTPRINFLDAPSFLEYQERVNYWRQFADELAIAKNTPNGVIVFNEERVKTTLLNRIEEHVKSAGPILIVNGDITSWDAKDSAFWKSLDENEAAWAAELLIILCALGCIEMRLAECEKEAA